MGSSVLKFGCDGIRSAAAGAELEISLATAVNSEVNWAGDRIEGMSGRYLFRGRVAKLT